MKIILAKIGHDKTVNFAFQELIRYLRKMDEQLHIEERYYDVKDASAEGILWIGLNELVPASEEDEIYIQVKNGRGMITGSNERAVLIGVYRFLRELGCSFLFPGKEGEVIPQGTIDIDTWDMSIREKASYRHRAVCIEGSVSYEHVYNMLDWIPKNSMNGYFMQFQVPFEFFARWNRQENNLDERNRKISSDDVRHIWMRLEEEIEKRGLMYHAVGHGWTCDAIGLSGQGWSEFEEAVPEEIKPFLAEIGGKRELFRGVPLNTNLCYSHPEVKKRLTDAIVDYCYKNPQVKYVHFWLADWGNNHCECSECSKYRPSDYYVMILNELDRKMTAAGIATKVVFLVYVDLMWAPEFHKLENQDRFVLMFAPITRTYTTPFVVSDNSIEDQEKNTVLMPYVRNKLIIPKKVSENLAYLSEWQKQFAGDSFVFDYHMMWDHMKDPGYYSCAKTLHADMVNLDKIGLNGMVSCQVQRAAFPTGLPMYAMANALWNKEIPFETIAEEYFTKAFGEDGKAVEQYLSTLSELFQPPYLRNELPDVDDEIAASFAKIESVVTEFKKNFIQKNSAKSASWKHLGFHADYCLILAKALMLRASGKTAESQKMARAVMEYLNSVEAQIETIVDVNNYNGKHMLGKLIK